MSTDVRAQNFIGGEWVDASSKKTIEVHDPSTGDVIFSAPDSTSADVDAAVAAAKSAFAQWGRTTPAERATALLALADKL